MPLTDEFENALWYATWRSVTKRFGQEGWDLVWMIGESLFEQLSAKHDFTGKTPIEAMQIMADELVKGGYFKGIEIEPINDRELYYSMDGAVIRPAADRLLAEWGEEAVPGHTSTAVMFAMLRRLFNLQARMIGLPERPENQPAREHWVLEPIG